MKVPEKFAAGWLLTLGLMFFMLPISSVMEKNLMERESKTPLIESAYNNSALLGIAFGIPTSFLGIWLTASLYLQERKEKLVLIQKMNQQLQSNFYRMLEENAGCMSVLNFAMRSQISTDMAREYLDGKAKELNADFKVSEQGTVFYYFNI
ncbi:MAG: hypothetical protein AAF316_13740 [Cyanobacteria bacterium P01_A01_bin.80]